MTAFSSLSTLLAMLTYRRPHDSDTLREFIGRFIQPLPNAERDPYGNWHVMVGGCEDVVWSCHTDTVHDFGGRQTLNHNPDTGIVKLSRKAKRGKFGSNCLGADDTAGVFICREMILAGVPGHYIFHHAEEVGSHGSSDLATMSPGLLLNARFAIAFDRRGYEDVITRQAGDRCCSDAFAVSLAAQLKGVSNYTPCDRGVFTDTANYTDLVGECTNLSVGYHDEHRRSEWLDTKFVLVLVEALKAIDSSQFIESRKAGDTEHPPYVATQSNLWHPADWPASHWKRSNDARVFEPASAVKPLYEVSDTAVCEQCYLAYDLEKSNARDYETFCGTECELAFMREILEDMEPRDRQSIYLDPAFDAINDAFDSRARKDYDDDKIH